MTQTGAIGNGADSRPQQRLDEWTKLDEVQMRYHKSQWDSPKQSTKALEAFAADWLKTARKVVDLGCGAGAATAYFAERYPSVTFEGKDYVNELLQIGNSISKDRGLQNLSFRKADWFALDVEDEIDGAISLQTLSWLPEFETPLAELFTKISPSWFALNSLFYDGEISCRIEVNELARNARSFYNVYSINEIARFCAGHGYNITKKQRFEIDIDIAPPQDKNVMSTYTMKVDGIEPEKRERVQISGPLLLSWYMVLIEKENG
jgi:ubiquinone/menaquinone biosynthesis C-methylase UbiE